MHCIYPVSVYFSQPQLPLFLFHAGKCRKQHLSICVMKAGSISDPRNIFWEFDTWVLGYITSSPSTIHNHSFLLLLLLHLYMHTCTYVYTTYWIYVALLVCTHVKRSRADYCDWKTSVGVYPWRNNSHPLSNHWLLIDWADTYTPQPRPTSSSIWKFKLTEIGICGIFPVLVAMSAGVIVLLLFRQPHCWESMATVHLSWLGDTL